MVCRLLDVCRLLGFNTYDSRMHCVQCSIMYKRLWQLHFHTEALDTDEMH